MISVQFPDPQFRIKLKDEKRYIFDSIRKAWLLLTEEEWVRQNMVAYIRQMLRYPKENIAVEKEILVNDLPKRFDILVYDTEWQPWMLVECKAPQVALGEGVLQQVLRYNLAVPAQWLVITNGHTTMAWEKKEQALRLVDELPAWCR